MRKILLATAVALLLPGTAIAADPQWFPLPTPESELRDVAGGPDGRAYFTLADTGEIGAIDPAGQMQLLPGQASDTSTGYGFGPTEIVAGADGAMYWLTDVEDTVGRYVPGGVPTLIFKNDRYGMEGIGAGAGGGVWLTFDHGTDADSPDKGIVRIGPDGKAKRLPGEYLGDLSPIATAPDGAAWYGDGGKALVRLTEDGQETRYPITPEQSLEQVASIAFDRSGGVWFSMYKPRSGWFSGANGGSIGRVVDGKAVVTPLRDTAVPRSLQLGPDGGMWFSSTGGIARTDASGVVTVAPITGAPKDGPGEMTFTSDGNIWFTDQDGNRLGRVDPRAAGFFPVYKGARPVFRVLGRVSKARKARAFDVRCTINDPGACQVKATVSKSVAKTLKLGKKRTLGTGTASGNAAGEVKVRVKLSKAVAKSLARVRKKVKVTFEVTVRGPQALSSTKKTVTLKR